MKMTKEMYDAEDTYCKRVLGYSMDEFIATPYDDAWGDYGEDWLHPAGYDNEDYQVLESITDNLEYFIEMMPEDAKWKMEASERPAEVCLPSEIAEVKNIQERIEELGNQIADEAIIAKG